MVGSTGGNVWASYVIVDYNNASLTTTDKAALKGMSFSGVDAVSLNNEFAITVSGTYAAGVCVPMKLVTIDYLGNVEQNVFWVKANEPALATINFVATPKANVEEGTAWAVTGSEKQEFKVPAGATGYALDWVIGEVDHRDAYTHYIREISKTAFKDGYGVIKSGKPSMDIIKLYKSNKQSTPANVGQIAYAEFVGKLNLQLMKEDKVYEGIIKFYDDKETFLGFNVLTIKKVLPTAVPANFSAKTNAINAGVLTVYPTPESKDDKQGEYKLAKAFNNWNSNYQLSIAGGADVASYDAGEGEGDDSTAKFYNINVVNSGKSYATTVKYNYGEIVYVPEGHGVVAPAAYTVAWDAFATQFNCLPIDSKYEWTETPVVYYRENDTIMGKITYDEEGYEIDFANVIKVTDPYGKEVNPFGNDVNWTTWAPQWNPSVGSKDNTPKISLITNGDKVTNSSLLNGAMKLRLVRRRLLLS